MPLRLSSKVEAVGDGRFVRGLRSLVSVNAPTSVLRVREADVPAVVPPAHATATTTAAIAHDSVGLRPITTDIQSLQFG